MTRGEEEDYEDRVHPLIHIVKYVFDLFSLYLSEVSSELLSKNFQNKKKDGLLMRETQTNIFRQFLTISSTVGAYVKDNVHGC
jgi:hypothetical protein